MEQTISRDGTSIAYRRSGVGKPLLLVHGATADHSRWLPILPRFEAHFTVYAMDRRGRSQSGDAPVYDLQREAEDIAAVVEAIGGPVALLGHSYGGLCSLEAALLTEGIDRLILYEPPMSADTPFYPPGVPERIQALAERGESEAALEVMFREVVHMPESELQMFRRLPAWQVRLTVVPTLGRELRTVQNYQLDPNRVARLNTPTLVLLGGDSPPHVRQRIERLHQALPDSHVVVMPGQGHVAMDTNPELFAGEVLRFLTAPRPHARLSLTSE